MKSIPAGFYLRLFSLGIALTAIGPKTTLAAAKCDVDPPRITSAAGGLLDVQFFAGKQPITVSVPQAVRIVDHSNEVVAGKRDSFCEKIEEHAIGAATGERACYF